ncbi:hypothetical protein O181_003869 [Austropuccinia psidii MF-1]|uniref:PIN domain-like protein n=1 Tax=Austropuccinia psidii MF-1 TaxID=1389203 RepID=A0A9Q3GE99_9BASI|nr:hypothetical protein [Austropuccinia psidii MF-1]
MGVQGLWNLITPISRQINLESLKNKKFAIDSSIWLYQFQSAMRDKEGRSLENSHIIGFIRRISKLLYYNIKPVFVFDGGIPILKKRTISERKKRRQGRQESLAKTAEKLLAAQLRQAAVIHAQKRIKTQDTGQLITPETTYFDQSISQDFSEKNSIKKRGRDHTSFISSDSNQSPLSTKKPKKTLTKDQYQLPPMDSIQSNLETSTDPRLATELELKQFIHQFTPEDIDFNSPEFQSLSTEMKYEIIGDLRVKSRQPNRSRVEAMRQRNHQEFSEAQILNLKQRNRITQQLLVVTDMVSKAHVTFPIKIAAQRNKEYVLVKGDQGWILGIDNSQETGSSKKPIKLDANSEDDDDDMVAEVLIGPSAQTARNDIHEGLSDSDDELEFEQVLLPPVVTSAHPEPQDPPEAAYIKSNKISIQDTKNETLDLDEEEAAIMKDIAAEIVSHELAHTSVHQQTSALNDLDEGLSHTYVSTNSTKPLNQTTLQSEYVTQPNMDHNQTQVNTRLPIELEVDEDFKSLRSSPEQTIATDQNPTSNLSEPLLSEVKEFEKQAVQSPTDSTLKLELDDAFVSLNKKSSSISLSTPKSSSFTNENMQQDLDAELSLSQSNSKLNTYRSKGKARFVETNTPEEVDALKELSSQLDLSILPNMPSLELNEACPPVSSITVKVLDDEPRNATNKPNSACQRTSAKLETQGDMSAFFSSLPDQQIVITQNFIQTGAAAVNEAHGANLVQELSEEPFPKSQGTSVVSQDPIETPIGPDLLNKELIDYSPAATSLLPSPEKSAQIIESDEEAELNRVIEAEEQELDTNLALESNQWESFLTGLENQEKLDQLRQEADVEVSRLKEQRAKDRRDADEVNQQMIQDIQALLKLFGIPYVTAPMEAEAQCAELLKLSLVDGIITDDSDVFLFGGGRVYKNMFNQNKFVECYLMSDLEKELSLDQEKLIQLAYLLGSDYTDGLPGVGPVTAMEILNEFEPINEKLELGGIIRFGDWWKKVQVGKDTEEESSSNFRKKFRKKKDKVWLEDNWPNLAVAEAYRKPTVDSSTQDFAWGLPDLDGIRQFLYDHSNWTWSKTDELIIPLIKRQSQNLQGLPLTQGILDHFFDSNPNSTSRLIHSKVLSGVSSQRLQLILKSWIEKQQRRNHEIIELDQAKEVKEGKNINKKVQEKAKKKEKPPKQSKVTDKKTKNKTKPKNKNKNKNKSSTRKRKDDDEYQEDENEDEEDF